MSNARRRMQSSAVVAAQLHLFLLLQRSLPLRPTLNTSTTSRCHSGRGIFVLFVLFFQTQTRIFNATTRIKRNDSQPRPLPSVIQTACQIGGLSLFTLAVRQLAQAIQQQSSKNSVLRVQCLVVGHSFQRMSFELRIFTRLIN